MELMCTNQIGGFIFWSQKGQVMSRNQIRTETMTQKYIDIRKLQLCTENQARDTKLLSVPI